MMLITKCWKATIKTPAIACDKRGVSESFPTVMLQNWKDTKILDICGIYRSFAKSMIIIL